MPEARFDFMALYVALDSKRESLGISWQQAARQVGRGISPSTLKRTSRGGPMEADGVLAMVRWLGLTIGELTQDAPDWAPPRAADMTRGRRFDTMAFYEAVDRRRLARGMTWKQVALELRGFSPPMLTRLARRGRMSIEQVVELSSWIGEAPETFTYASRR